MTGLVKSLKREFFGSKEYRHAYAEEFLNASIATQIKVLREQRNLRQIDLAEIASMKQSMISRLENVNYSSWSINTLKRLAEAFDVVLTVRFERFKDLVLDADRFSRKSLEVTEFDKDTFFNQSSNIGSSIDTPAFISYTVNLADVPEEKETIASIDLVVAAAETDKNIQYQIST